jgi:hypothetical protein
MACVGIYWNNHVLLRDGEMVVKANLPASGSTLEIVA